MSNIEYQTKSNIQIECRISNQSNSNRMLISNIIQIQIECRISNIKLNPTFKSNVEYRINPTLNRTCRISNIKLNLDIQILNIYQYQTKSNIQIECRISNIKLNLNIQILNVEYRISN